MIINILILIILILINAFFAGSEIAYITLNDYTLDKQVKKGNKKAKKIKKILENQSGFLSLIQVGVTLAGFLASAFAADTFVEKLLPLFANMPIDIGIIKNLLMVLITILISFLTLIFGELVPKKIGINYAEKIAYATIDILFVISKIFKPFIILLTKITNLITKNMEITDDERKIVLEEQIKAMLDSGVEEGSLKESEKNVIENALELNDKKVKDVMTKFDDVICVSINSSIQDIITIVQKYKYSRLPVYGKDKKNIVGVLHTKDLIIKIAKSKGTLEIEDVVRPILRVSKMKKIDKVLILMKKAKNHIAVVENSKNEMIGLITMEDIIEELVGEIYDEYDSFKK